MNTVILIGNLTKDPEFRTTQSNISCCNFTLAVSRKFKSADGTREADFIPIVAWRATADYCSKYLKKGYKAAVRGSLQMRSYEGQDGQKRYITEVVADEINNLTSRADSYQDDSAQDLPEVQEKKARIQDAKPIEDDGALPF